MSTKVSISLTLAVLISVGGLSGTAVSPGDCSNYTTDDAGIRHMPFYNFDDVPLTLGNAPPTSGGSLQYFLLTSGQLSLGSWRSTKTYADGKTYEIIKPYIPTGNTSHMGYEYYGFLEIDNSKKIYGNSLKFTVTGGVNATSCPSGGTVGTTAGCYGRGTPLYHKQSYLDYGKAGQDPVYHGNDPVGSPYLYFQNSSLSNAIVPFQQSQGANRMSIYIWAPEGLSIGQGGYNVQPVKTLQVGPYSSMPYNLVYPGGDPAGSTGTGGHWYHEAAINGGGWIHMVIDAHPQHNNAWSSAASYPYPSSSLRDFGGTYFNNLFKIYFATFFYGGFEKTPFSFYYDDIEFQNDPEPQNNETINSPAVMYNPKKNAFELSFNTKYKNTLDYGTFEVRYSFSPITNASFSSATPVHILPSAGFYQLDNTSGRFARSQPYYQATWTSFKLTAADQRALVPGKKVFFAIKDVSQKSDSPLDPVASISALSSAKGGRDYRNKGTSFDYAGDAPALPLIKRIDYVISEKLPPRRVQNIH